MSCGASRSSARRHSLDSPVSSSFSSSSSSSTSQQCDTCMEPNSCDLARFDWFWGKASREEVDSRMVGQPEGSFCIRNSSTPGDYTLTLRKEGCNKLIKIYIQNNRCSLSPNDSTSFESLAQLVDYYCTHSLQAYNRCLNIVLRHAVPRYCNLGTHSQFFKIGQIVKEFATAYIAYLIQSADYDKLYERYQQLCHHLEGRRQALLAFEETIKFFEENLQLHHNYRSKAAEHEEQRLMENFELLNARMDSLVESKKKTREEIELCSVQFKEVDCKLNDMKPELYRLFKQQEASERLLSAQGVPISAVYQQLFAKVASRPDVGKVDDVKHDLDTAKRETEDDEDDQSAAVFEACIEAGIQAAQHSSWLLADCSREQCLNLLRDKPNGSYLVRPSASRSGCYALSVVSAGQVFNCLIEMDNFTYGFSGTEMLFSSLSDLILYYSINSLKNHNPHLDTVLKYPVGAPVRVDLPLPKST